MEIKPEFSRTAMLLGKDAVNSLANSSVAVFGIGGVGGAVCEALARAGVGEMTLIDGDTVAVSNINRQIIALHSTVGMDKTDAAKARILDINPGCKVNTLTLFYGRENENLIDFSGFDCVVDAIDTVTSKLLIIEKCTASGIPVISAMGTGNKTDPSRLRLSDISKTSMCPLAKVMRHELKKRGIKHLDVVFSDEEITAPKKEFYMEGNAEDLRHLPAGTLSTVPNTAGLIIASAVINRIAGTNKTTGEK